MLFVKQSSGSSQLTLDGNKVNKMYSDLYNTRITTTSINTAVAKELTGGYKQIGKCVYVNVRFKLVNKYQHAVILYNLPEPVIYNACLSAYNETASRPSVGQVKSNSNLEWHDSSQSNTNDTCIICGCYMCK